MLQSQGFVIARAKWNVIVSNKEEQAPSTPTPNLCMQAKSSKFWNINEYTGRMSRGLTYHSSIPDPLSLISMDSLPYSRTRTSTEVAPASRLFSTNSFTAIDRSRITWPLHIRCTELLSAAWMLGNLSLTWSLSWSSAKTTCILTICVEGSLLDA